jgi:Phage tail assembly chaperone proteins, E, or 41 or 14
MRTITLKQPIKINGSDIREINLDLESLKGRDLIELESGFRSTHRGEYVPVLNIDMRFQAWVAGRVSGINHEDLLDLYAPDFSSMCSEIQSFLLSGG